MVKCEQWLEALVTLSVAQDCWILEEINVTIRTCMDEPERSQGENRVGEEKIVFASSQMVEARVILFTEVM